MDEIIVENSKQLYEKLRGKKISISMGQKQSVEKFILA